MAKHYESGSSSSEDSDFFDEKAIQPYRFEPVFSPEELENRRRERESREATFAGSEGEEERGQPRSRKDDSFWCSCGRCHLTPTEDECICCHEVHQAQAIVDRFDPQEMASTSQSAQPSTSAKQQKCVTEHPDFEAHLNEGVLDTYFRGHQYNWKKFPKPRGPGGTLNNAQYRLVAYRFILDWLLQGERLGRKKRMPLPACVVSAIRRKYSADDQEYTGFKYAELPTVKFFFLEMLSIGPANFPHYPFLQFLLPEKCTYREKKDIYVIIVQCFCFLVIGMFFFDLMLTVA